MGDFRLFIALELTPEQRQACSRLIENLQKGVQFTQCHPQWVSAEQMHLTLKFLGDTPEKRVPALVEKLAAPIARYHRFDLTYKGLGVFPNERQPRVLWLGAGKGGKKVTELQSTVEENLAALKFPRENREFHPHLTLARIKALRGSRAFMDVVKSHERLSLPTGEIREVHLIRSVLKPSGAEYETLHRWLLSSPGPVPERADS